MKFSALVVIVANELEDEARRAAEDAGAGGVTILSGRGSGVDEKKSFLGLQIEGHQTVLLYVLERRIAVRALKAVVSCSKLMKSGHGIAFTVPIEHIGGVNTKEIAKFEERIREDI